MAKSYYEASGYLMHHTDELKKSTFNIKNEKSRDIFIDWIKERASLLEQETIMKNALEVPSHERDSNAITFLKPYEVPYSAGDVILVELGYNIGHEYGGKHFCIVMKDNHKLDKNVIVLPLTSQSPKNTQDADRHHALGILPFLNTNPRKVDKSSFAKLNCLIQVSKLRLKNNLKVKGTIDQSEMKKLEEALTNYLLPGQYNEKLSLVAENQRKEAVIVNLQSSKRYLQTENRQLKEKIEALEKQIAQAKEGPIR